MNDHEHAEALDVGLDEDAAQEETIIPIEFKLQENEHVHFEAIGGGEESPNKGDDIINDTGEEA